MKVDKKEKQNVTIITFKLEWNKLILPIGMRWAKHGKRKMYRKQKEQSQDRINLQQTLQTLEETKVKHEASCK